MVAQLSTGICKRLVQGRNSEQLWTTRIYVQILSIKPALTAGERRYRLILSDGQHYTQSMLATQLNSLIESPDPQLKKYTVVCITRLSCSLVQNKRLIIVLGVDGSEHITEKIGDPSTLDTIVPATATGSGRTPPPSIAPPVTSSPAHASASKPQTSNCGTIVPIEGLNPFRTKWTIKARISQKSNLRTYSNQRGDGKLFNIILVDDSSEIRVTFFNALVDKWYERLREGQVYFVSKARITLAKKQFSNIQNEHELMTDDNTSFEECDQPPAVPVNKYTFTELGSLREVASGSTADVLAVVKEVGPVGEITAKSTNKKLTKRELTLVDRSNFAVYLTLWGKHAENWIADDQPVVAFKAAKVSDFGGRSLSLLSSSSFAFNPDITEAHLLREWFDDAGSQHSFQTHTSGLVGGVGPGLGLEETKTLFDVKNDQLGTHEKPDYFNTRATVLHIKPDNLAYPGCPAANCNKKVIDVGGEWRCEKCECTFERPEYRYMISFTAADHTGSLWLTGFNDVGLAIFGMTADELQEIREHDDVKFNDTLQTVSINTYNFVARAKQETFNDKTRVRYSVTRLSNLDYREESNHLVALLKSDWAK